MDRDGELLQVETWILGPFVLHASVLIYLAAVASGYGVMYLRLFRKPEGEILGSIIMNGLLLWVLVWKGSQLILNFKDVLEQPMSLIYFNGGMRGVVMAFVISVIYFVIAVEKRQISRHIYINSLFAASIGGYAVFQLLTFGFSPDSEYSSLWIGFLGLGLTIVWLRMPLPASWRITLQRMLVFGLGCVLIVTLSNQLWVKKNQQVQEQTTAGLKIGQQAPDFEVSLLTGETVKLSDYRGKTVFLNFWATWCPPCRAEMPHMQQFYTKHQQGGVVVLGLNATNTEASTVAVKAWLQEWGINFPILLDKTGEISERYRVNAYPATYIIDPEGYIRLKFPGPMNEEMLEQALAKIK